MTRVYIDTSAFLALVDQADSHHAAVVRTFEVLAEERAQFWTSSYVLVESSALIRNRLGMKAVRRFGEVVQEAVEVFWIEGNVHWRAWKQSSSSGRRGPGLVDCSSFILMLDHRMKTVLAIDRHFEQQEFEVLPRPGS